MKVTLKPFKALYRRVLAAVCFITLAVPNVAYASGTGPATIQAGVSDGENLATQAGEWAFGLLAAGAAFFLIRAWWTMHSADDDSQYAKGRKHLVRSIITLVGAGCTSAILATVRTTFGF
ncbi:hypothetical protein NZD89_28070 (plasmid) [Alicyclobacillus fastidiosus]|uniref:Conjugal transfer protein n=1 Tax=Alicyclobacillus fastidiosus TaxID=392011 RepID=A0ABY6ZPZ4_9BACL|nr:hypothetical protein [Alicyclobacillus fastidiosus]WAH44907.1 hypothetical protein NZD89_28070 [Alicyclobacillus fastidiosus]GMA65667.1 hypothetical protein GCM10025859_61070 [Alicyclobacillus fastidiosus]